MIQAMITGTIYDGPTWRETKAGEDYVTARIISIEPNRDYRARVAVSAYLPDTAESLASFKDGDAVCISGQLWPRFWADKRGEPQITLSLTADRVEPL